MGVVSREAAATFFEASVCDPTRASGKKFHWGYTGLGLVAVLCQPPGRQAYKLKGLEKTILDALRLVPDVFLLYRDRAGGQSDLGSFP